MYCANPSLSQRLSQTLRDTAAKLRGHNFYSGPYSSWTDAQRISSGYDDKDILNKAVAAQDQVVAGHAVYERDTKLFYSEDYNSHLLEAIERAAAVNNKGELNIIDFGGALGSGYFQHRKPLEERRPFLWNVVEQKMFIDKGQQLYQNEELRFHEKIEDIESHPKTQLFILSSVLQYLEEPFALLEYLLEIKPDFIFIDRTPFIEHLESLISVQHVPAAIYSASYPSWLFAEPDILNIFSQEYFIDNCFEALDGKLRSGRFHISYRGCLLAKRT